MTDSPTRPLKVFLCHASADKPAVRKLYRYLRSMGMDPWLDAEKLLPGDNWEAEIPNALFDSDVILVCLSKNSVNKEGYVQKEIVFALDEAMEKPEGTIFIIPAKLEECDVPQRLNRYQWVDLYRDDGRKRLMLSLNKRAAQIGPAVEQAIISDDTEREPSQESDSTVPSHKLARKPDFWHKLAELNGITVFSILMIFVIVGIGIFENLHILFPTSSIPTMAATIFPILTETLTPEPIVAAPTETLDIGSTLIGKDGMTLLYVPAGEFTMGSNQSANEKPIHMVNLGAFWIDQTEITNAMYAKCVDTGLCNQPSSIKSYTRDSYYGNPKFDDYPVIYVNWNSAKTYCEWADRRLPTEAEWEKAARGTDVRTYPWGNNVPDDNLLNYHGIVIRDATEVGMYPDGSSPYGALDMAGNVWEWVADWYDYYGSSSDSNPLGPNSGQFRVHRGGAWYSDASDLRSASRDRSNPANTIYSVGFRCAMSATP